MIKKQFNNAEGVYTAPLCTISEICQEGILCASFDIDPSVDEENEINPYSL